MDWDGGGASIALLASGGSVLQRIFSSIIISHEFSCHRLFGGKHWLVPIH